MSAADLPVRVIVGIDGSGRTHRLRRETRTAAPQVLVPRRADLARVTALVASAPAGSVLVLDDAHEASPDVLLVLLEAVQDGRSVALARRPGAASPELGDLEDAVLESGRLVTLAPWGIDDVARCLHEAGHSGDDAAQVLWLGSGAPWVVAALAHDGVAELGGGRSGRWPTLRAALDRRLGRLPPAAIPLVEVLAVAGAMPGLADEAVNGVVSEAAEVRHLHLAGLLDETSRTDGRDRLVSAVARVVAADLTTAERHRHAARLTAALLAGGADALLLPSRPDSALLAGAQRAAREGRLDRVAELLASAQGPAQRSLAVPALVATGQLAAAGELVAAAGSVGAAELLASACLLVGELSPDAVLPRLVEAAERFSAIAVEVPAAPHAIAAAVAVAAGDAATGERLLAQGVAGPGGPGGRWRFRLLDAWVRQRTGRGDPSAVLRESAAVGLDPRDRVVRAAIAAGAARRAHDIAALRACWDDAAEVLARRTVDLFAVEPVEELVLAAARLDQHRRADVLVADLAAAAPPGVAMWRSALAWMALQVAVVGDDAAAADDAASRLAASAELPTAGPRQRAQATAGRAWADALAGDIDAETVLDAVEALVIDAELPWEGGRLAGQAAVRTADPRVARRLLERARDLSGALDHPTPAAVADTTAVSERELEVARLVLAGRTHREIGAQLYISPKTVEHHVARIRTKLGARDRAEFVTALRVLVAGREMATRD